MTQISLSLVAMIIIFACGPFKGEGIAADSTVAEALKPTFCTTFSFHYLETENVLYSSVVRHVEVFLDERAFSEKNLRTLFEYLSKQNPQPIHLTVVVHTNWDQLSMPSDCPGYGISEQPADPHEYDYLQAIYYRRQGQAYFRYSPTPHIEDANFKTVEMRKQK